jgi:hypothetical protein
MKDTALIIEKAANGFIVRSKYDPYSAPQQVVSLDVYVFENFGTLKMFLAQWSNPPKVSK